MIYPANCPVQLIGAPIWTTIRHREIVEEMARWNRKSLPHPTVRGRPLRRPVKNPFHFINAWLRRFSLESTTPQTPGVSNACTHPEQASE